MTEPSDPTAGAFFRQVLWLGVFAIPALTANVPLVEYDTGWHLRTGQWIVQQHAVPWHDDFSTVGVDKLWVAYSWLFSVLLYTLHQIFGGYGIIVYRTVAAVLIVLALARFVGRREGRPLVVVALTAAGTIGMFRLLVGERPGLLTILFAITTLDSILALRDGKAGKRVWLLPLVYVLWANIHVQFVHGLFLLGVAWLAPVIAFALGRDDPDDATRFLSPGWVRLSLLTFLCAAATLLTPYHVYLYSVIWTYTQLTVTHEMFGEMKPMEFRFIADWMVLGLFVAAWYVMGRRHQVTVWNVLLLVSTAYFGFHAKHDVWLIVLASLAVLSGPSTELGPWRWGDFRLAWIAPAAALLFVGLAKPRDLETLWRAEFPLDAVEAVRAQKLPGPIWNAIDWGGLLIWTLPDRQVTIDGRAQLHGDDRIARSYRVWNGRPGWDKDPDFVAARTIIVHAGAPLAELLQRDTRFRLVYEDKTAAIFARRP